MTPEERANLIITGWTGIRTTIHPHSGSSNLQDITVVGAQEGARQAIVKAIREAVEAEREACAQLADSADKNTHPADLADLIRERTDQ